MQKIVTTIIDDIDNTPNAQTFLFSFNDQQYEIDLSSNNRRAFQDSISQFVKHARPMSRKKRKNRTVNGVKTTPQAHTSNGRIRSQEIRDWAKSQGISVRDRGRIPGHIVEQYRTQKEPPKTKFVEPVTAKKGKTKSRRRT
jgi:hypothetical protein